MRPYHTNPWSIPSMPRPLHRSFLGLNFWHYGNLTKDIFIKEESFPPGISFHPGGSENIKISDIFYCAGLLTSPNSNYSFPNAWGFFLENYNAFSIRNNTVRIIDQYKSIDSRIRTIFIERLAIGYAGYLLWKSYGVIHIADAGQFINRTISNQAPIYNSISLRSLGLYGSNGGLKPDFFCVASSGECVIAEAKGSIGAPGTLSYAKTKGKNQVKNVNPIGITVRGNAGRLVFATNLRYKSDRPHTGCDSTVTIVDPEKNNKSLDIEITANDIVLYSYCKFFSFCGYSKLSELLLKNKSLNIYEYDFHKEEIKIGKLNFLVLLNTLGYIVGIEKEIATNLLENKDGLSNNINKYLKSLKLDTIVPNDYYTIFPNGTIYGLRK